MSYFESIAKENFPADDDNGRARLRALESRELGEDFLKAMVDFRSSGRVLVIGSSDRIAAVMADTTRLSDCTFVVTEGRLAEDADRHEVYHASVQSCEGYLGAFRCVVSRDGQDFDLGELVDSKSPHFDMVIDLTRPRLIDIDLPPLGYFAPDDEVAFAHTLEQLEQFTGEFHKPRFFRYNADICAHGRSGLDGCTLCIDNCPTSAIISIGESVEVNPYLCQGGGVCTSTCPTGAMTYAWPPVTVVGDRVKATIHAYLEAGGVGPVILFHDGESGVECLRPLAAQLESRVIPFAVEEVAATGPELWIAALDWGAAGVALLTTDAISPSIRQALNQQCAVANEIVTGAGLEGDRIIVVAGAAQSLIDRRWPAAHDLERASFSIADSKRNAIRVAVDHIARAHNRTDQTVALPPHAPFGRINVNQQSCTLCMGCVSVCPADALVAGGDTPALRHVEWNCVQCGACEVACPEQAISLQARFVYDNDQRMSTTTLNEEEPFHCISCGKAFATASVMARMEQKLADHWMFQKPEQRNRLKMCEDCRIADMFDKDGGLAAHEPSK